MTKTLEEVCSSVVYYKLTFKSYVQ